MDPTQSLHPIPTNTNTPMAHPPIPIMLSLVNAMDDASPFDMLAEVASQMPDVVMLLSDESESSTPPSPPPIDPAAAPEAPPPQVPTRSRPTRKRTKKHTAKKADRMPGKWPTRKQTRDRMRADRMRRVVRFADATRGDKTFYRQTHYAPGPRRYPKRCPSRSTPLGGAIAVTPSWTHRVDDPELKRRRQAACARAQRQAEVRADALAEANDSFAVGEIAAGQEALCRALKNPKGLSLEAAYAAKAEEELRLEEQLAMQAQFEFLRSIRPDFPMPENLASM